MTSLAINLWILVGVTAACWLASVVTREYSWVDRIWSIVPVAYVWVFALGTHDARATLVAVLVTVWGARLTFNFAKRGGYAPGGEDYRWGIIRSRVPGWAFAVSNFAVIAAGAPLLWTAAGAVLLTLLFLGSTAFTEWTSKSRHPEFEDYQHSTSMLVPWRPRRDAR